MAVEIRPYTAEDVAAMMDIWNEVVEDGIAFPQEETLDLDGAREFFGSQSHCGVAAEDGCVLGLYILHPNNLGRCGHIANASYAVSGAARGKGVGRLLVSDSLKQCPEYGFRVLQFNAVVASNASARHLYESLGFVQLGTIPGGFRMPDGTYADICPYYHLA
ncbi:MAG: GNAT family N-acetyltransferase [Eggerthellaceae bacterium]|nr:GNAT family N-acetyltransferase [Eggerthellaceae bacterium]